MLIAELTRWAGYGALRLISAAPKLKKFTFTLYRSVKCTRHSVLGGLCNTSSKHVIGTKGLTSVHRVTKWV